MLYYLSVALVLLYSGTIAFFESFFYAISLPLCLKLNIWIATKFVRRLLALFKHLMGLTLHADSSEKESLPERCLVMANHQSFLDIVVLFAHLDGPRLKFVAKDAIDSKLPIVATMLKTDGHCLVASDGRGEGTASDMKTLDDFAQRAEENNWIPVIFPEGACSRDGRVRPFQAAGFRRLENSSPLPVAVFAIDGGWQYSDIPDLIKIQRCRKGDYRVKLLKVFPAPAGRKDQKRILSEARELVCAQLEAWRSSKEQA